MQSLAFLLSSVRRLGHDRRAGVSVIGALSLTALIGITGLGVEMSQGYAMKVANQRIADAAALAAALAYTADPDARLLNAAQSIALANGVAPNGVTIEGPTAEGNRKIIAVTIATEVPLRLTRVFTSALAYTVRATGVASVSDGGNQGVGGNDGAPCVLALSTTASTGVDLSGGTSINAPGCVISANGPVTLSGGAEIQAQQVVSAGAITRNGGARITTKPKTDNILPSKAGAASDPLAANDDLDKALKKLDAMPSVASADIPAGDDWDLNYNPAANVAKYRVSNGEYVIPPGAYAIRRLSISGGMSVKFQGSQSSSITISNGLENNGNSLVIGDGSLTIKGLAHFNSTTTGIGNGAHAFADIKVDGGKTLTIGDGSFVSGTISTSGGSRIAIGATDNHYVNGSLNLAGAATFGAGAYTVKGNFNNTTGCGQCTMQGKDVSFFLSGAVTLGGGSGLDISAPEAKVGEALPGILFASRSPVATQLTGGTNILLSGIWWSPNAPFTMEGGASLANTGRCFALIVSTVSLKGGTHLTTAPCAAISGDDGAPAKITLVR